jgi:hypothetical protein
MSSATSSSSVAHLLLYLVNIGSGNDQTLEVAAGSAISEEYAIRRLLRQVAGRRSHSVISHINLASD